MSEDLKVTEYEVALFSGMPLVNPAKILSNIVEHVEQLQGGQQTVLPIPPSTPVEVPRVVVGSLNNTFELRITLDRLDLFYRNTDDHPDFKANEIKTVLETLLNVDDFKRLNFTRIGFITTGAKLIENDAEFIGKSFLQENAVAELKNFNVQVTYESDGNNLALFATSAQKQETGERGVIIKADFNTPAEKTLNLKQDDVLNFIEDAISKDYFEKARKKLGA